MTPKLSQDVEQIVAATPDGAIHIQGTTGATYWVLTEQAMRVRQYVLQGLAEADGGKLGPWDPQAVKTDARRRLQERLQK